MIQNMWRPVAVGVVVVLVLAAAIAAFMFGGFSKSVSEMVQLTGDVSYLGIVASHRASTIAYEGSADGTLTKIPDAPEGEEIVAVARGGTSLAVLTRVAGGTTNRIYQLVDGAYVVRHEGENLTSFLEVSPDGSLIGFAQVGEGEMPTVYSIEVGKNVPDEIGEGTLVRFFIHEGTVGAWFVNGGTLAFRLKEEDLWTGTIVVYQGEGMIKTFATNGASRFAFTDPVTGKTEERVIDTLDPFTSSSLGSYEPMAYTHLFFNKTGFFGIDTSNDTLSIFPLERKDEKTTHTLTTLPSPRTVFVLNP